MGRAACLWRLRDIGGWPLSTAVAQAGAARLTAKRVWQDTVDLTSQYLELSKQKEKQSPKDRPETPERAGKHVR